MAGEYDATPVVQAVQSILQDDLPAYLDAIDTAYGDDITLDDLAEVRVAPVDDIEDFPGSVVDAPESRERLDLEKDGIWSHDISIFLVFVGDVGTAADADPAGLYPTEVLNVRCNRTISAVIECLKANTTLTVDSVEHCISLGNFRVSRSGFGGPLDEEDADQMYRKEAFIRFLVLVQT